MVPRSIRRVTDLPPSAKLREMKQNTHRLVQLIKAATPDVPNQTLMPQLSEQMLNACPMPPMCIIIRLLPGVKVPFFLIMNGPMPSWGPYGGEESTWLHHPCLP